MWIRYNCEFDGLPILLKLEGQICFRVMESMGKFSVCVENGGDRYVLKKGITEQKGIRIINRIQGEIMNEYDLIVVE